jgi:hypothetical protein
MPLTYKRAGSTRHNLNILTVSGANSILARKHWLAIQTGPDWTIRNSQGELLAQAKGKARAVWQALPSDEQDQIYYNLLARTKEGIGQCG